MEENNKTEKQITIYLEDSGYAHSFKKMKAYIPTTSTMLRDL